jgi:UPF0271 protein
MKFCRFLREVSCANHALNDYDASMEIDLNCDLGEFENLADSPEAALLPLISSANVCCGAHAGSQASIDQVLFLAKRHGVRVGAHPGYADREHFGRREHLYRAETIKKLIVEQTRELQARAAKYGLSVQYIKPHGALYNQACREISIAAEVALAGSVLALPIMGLPGSYMERTCFAESVPFLREGFADRRYRADGTLVPRTEANSLILDAVEAIAQAEWLLLKGGIDSLCVHGDHPQALAFVTALRQAFELRHITVRAPV